MTIVRTQIVNQLMIDSDFEVMTVQAFSQAAFKTVLDAALQAGWLADPSNFEVVFANGFFFYFTLVFRKL